MLVSLSALYKSPSIKIRLSRFGTRCHPTDLYPIFDSLSISLHQKSLKKMTAFTNIPCVDAKASLHEASVNTAEPRQQEAAINDGLPATDTPNDCIDPFELSPQYAYTPRKIRVFTIGAGFSGLIMAHKFQHRFPAMRNIVEHTMFEARGDVGGTWLANHYPGVQCDVPAHIYVSNDCQPSSPEYQLNGSGIPV